MKIRPTKTGPKVEAVQYHHRPPSELPKQVAGEHLWIVVSMYRVHPKRDAEYQLDTENLLTIEGPGCYWCEEPWNPRAAAKPCAGRPKR